MSYLTAKQFSEIWDITERRIIKLCKEGRISGALKSGMVWQIPEDTLKPSDKRSSIYKYINIPKRVLIVNCMNSIKDCLLSLINKEGYIAEFKELSLINENLSNLSKYYEGLVYFPKNNINNDEKLFINEISNRLNYESNIVIVDYNKPDRYEIEKKLSAKFKREIGLNINSLILDIDMSNDILINYSDIAENILELLFKLRGCTGNAIITCADKIEFDSSGRTSNLKIGKFYKALNTYFRKLNKDSYLWCASIMLEDEWTESPQEMKFRLLNLEAANRGVNIERIFIFSKHNIKKYKENKTLKIYAQSNIKTLFVDYDEIKEKQPNLLDLVGNGWDGIDENTLIVDLPVSNDERGYITKNTKDVMNAYNCFQELKKYSINLKDLLI